MIIIPREKPVVKELNTYYLNIDRLVEHYQGELGTGAVYFRSPVAEAALFFDEQSVVNGYIEERKQTASGDRAVERIMDMAAESNFSVSVYKILPERIYFWANLVSSQPLYSNLTSEFTDLDGLIRKMEGEQLTGFIDIELNDGGGGLLFFYKGQVLGGSSADGGSVDRSTEYRDDLVKRSKQYGGRFSVSRVFLESEEKADETAEAGPGSLQQEPEVPSETMQPAASPGSGQPVTRERALEMLGELIGSLESVVRKNRRIRSDFETLLYRKFLEKADKYDFLDPFLAEFRYSSGRVRYSGTAGAGQLVEAVEQCVYEIASANGVLSPLRSRLAKWRKNYADEIEEFDVRL